ncbi:MAG: alpha/beta hydrolase [Kiritimatiellae bacterium]|nr:alpha/beta hydrolase [Kiritimatiellia bacterium]
MKTFVLNGWSAAESAWSLCLFPRDAIFDYIDQLDGLSERAVQEAEDGAILVGWSMGGSTALRIATKYPDRLRALVLVAATPRMMKDKNWAGMSERRLAALEAGLRLTRGDGLFPRPAGLPSPYILDSSARLERGLDYLRRTDLRLDLIDLLASGRLKCPVWIFQSEHDGIVRPENATFLKAVFPEATVEMVSGSEHALPVFIPEKIDAAVAAAQMGE